MDININEIFHDQITKLSSSFIPPGFKGNVRSIRIMQDYLAKLIDFLGEQSTKAQGLSKVITTSEKFRDSSEQMLYLLKDAEANDGKGEIIGMLKMGRKHLFLFDEREFLEVEPLCVLDFFVLRDRQRLGYGKLLFDYMLHDLNIQAYELAVDGPSPKMIAFLMKNYGVGRMIRQNNNFAVAPQFFNNRDQFISRSGHTAPVVSATDSRCAIGLTKPTSAIASIIHGGDSYVPEPKSGYSRIGRAMNSH